MHSNSPFMILVIALQLVVQKYLQEFGKIRAHAWVQVAQAAFLNTMLLTGAFIVVVVVKLTVDVMPLSSFAHSACCCAVLSVLARPVPTLSYLTLYSVTLREAARIAAPRGMRMMVATRKKARTLLPVMIGLYPCSSW